MTEDKDFGELIVVQRRPHSGITFFLELSNVEQVVAMQEVLTYDEVDWKWGGMIVVARGRIRVRPWA